MIQPATRYSPDFKNRSNPVLIWLFGELKEIPMWETTEEYIHKLMNGDIIRIPKGFKYNKASIPRGFWTAFPPFGRSDRATLIHDYLYVIDYLRDELGMRVARAMADEEFVTVMIEDGVPKARAKLFYWMVVLFGRSVYKKRRG